MQSEKPTIQQIHDDVFEFLLDKHFEEKRKGKDFFFTMFIPHSTKKKPEYLMGEGALLISFWYSFNEKKDAPIHFAFNTIGTVALFLSSKKIYKNAPNSQIIKGIGGMQKIDQAWYKYYSTDNDGSHIDKLQDFINTDKIFIDNNIHLMFSEIHTDYENKSIEARNHSNWSAIDKESFLQMVIEL